MIETVVTILAILYVSMILQNKYKIPSPITIVLLTFGISSIYPQYLSNMNIGTFSEEMTVFIVLLVLVDAFIIRLDEIKKNWVSIVYLAGIAVVLSILAGIFLLDYTIFGQYNLQVGAVIALFAMCLATDPVTLFAILKQYTVPHRLKFLAEGESLFNDAVALIMFSSIGLYMLQGNEITVSYAVQSVLSVIGGATIIGIITGIIGIYLLKKSKDTITELVVVLFVAYFAFYYAEHFHFSGLLAEIIAVITMTTIIDRVLDKSSDNIQKTEKTLEENKRITQKVKHRLLSILERNVTEKKAKQDISMFLNVLALFVNVVLFTSLAILVDFSKLIFYKEEIIIMFLLTTIIRFLMMAKFVYISGITSKIPNLDIKGWLVLSFAGIKGGLSIVMLHMLANTVKDFQHMELFVSVVTGVILLSMFIYTVGLVTTILVNKKEFIKEVKEETHH